MRKKLFFLLTAILCIHLSANAIDSWIRINQLGYLPNSPKKAILLSESPLQIQSFSIYDALTNEEIETFHCTIARGPFQSFKSTYVLDFSSFHNQGAFYLKAGLTYSPTVYISKNTYMGTADYLLNFLRKQRYNNTTALKVFTEVDEKQLSEKIISPKPQALHPVVSKKTIPSVTNTNPLPKYIYAHGGWMDPQTGNQYSAITAQSTYSLLMAYQFNPISFSDRLNESGDKTSNKIPDILDEAKYGLQWMLSTFPNADTLYIQLSQATGNCNEPLLYPINTEVTDTHTNYLSGAASLAGKYAATFGLAAEIFARINPQFADTLKQKAIDAFNLGIKYPGVCRTIQLSTPMEEEDWADDMETAAAHLYRITYKSEYIQQAVEFGRKNPVSPWMCSDTASHYQWYPFINMGHYQLANTENPRFSYEFMQNIKNGLQRMAGYASGNPFDLGIPMIRNSNNMVVALATMCKLYRKSTNDSTYMNMETALIDWLFGRNIWGIPMVCNLPKWSTNRLNYYRMPDTKMAGGALVNGPVSRSSYEQATGQKIKSTESTDRFQTSTAVYFNGITDSETNLPSIDGTASLTYLLAGLQQDGVAGRTNDPNTYTHGAISRTNPEKKQISLVFVGHDATDGFKTIRKTLDKQNIKASFFFTGDFFRHRGNSGMIKDLIKDGHYVGAHSDKMLAYCSWRNKDSVVVSKSTFMNDIRHNYEAMQKFNLKTETTPFFVAPYDYYNDSITAWCHEVGLTMLSATPGTLCSSDNSTPEMRERYYSSNEIYNKIIQTEKKSGLNGYILIFHMGTDKRRQDKFYSKLLTLITDLKKEGYQFPDIYQATDILDKCDTNKNKGKQKRKN